MKYEYLTLRARFENQKGLIITVLTEGGEQRQDDTVTVMLNKLGNLGFELVTVVWFEQRSTTEYYLKRQIS